MSRGWQVWKPATQQTGKSALQRNTPGAAPLPIFRTSAKAGCDGIVSDVAGNPRILVIIPNPVIVRFRLPKRFLAHAQNSLGAARCELFPRFQNITQHLVRHRPDEGMTVIWHHNPIVQQIPGPVKVSQCVRDEIGNVVIGGAGGEGARCLLGRRKTVRGVASQKAPFCKRSS